MMSLNSKCYDTRQLLCSLKWHSCSAPMAAVVLKPLILIN